MEAEHPGAVTGLARPTAAFRGERLVFLPGLDGTGISWEPLAPFVAPDADVTVVRYPANELLSFRETVECAARQVSSADEAIVIAPGQRLGVPTGWSMELPAGFEAQVRPRSGLSLKHGVTVVNAPGTIDSDYRGEIVVLLVNLGQQPYTIAPGDRVAQMVISPVSRATIEEAEDLSATSRGAGGFGHTG